MMSAGTPAAGMPAASPFPLPSAAASVAAATGALALVRGRIAAQHAAGAPALATAGLAAEGFDRIVTDVWQGVLAELPPATATLVRGDATLLAIGGFGRGEMLPFSDIDLMVLHGGRCGEAVGAAAKRLLQQLFDAGLQVGQSVRTQAEAVRLAGGDATILSSLLDARLLVGRPEAAAGLARRLEVLGSRRGLRLAGMLMEARREESEKFGQTPALLEPNVKRSPGGLRDIQLVRWLGKLTRNAGSLADLVLLGGLSRRDAEALTEAAEFLTWVRTDLHLAAGKCADDLTRDQQVRIAAVRGLESTAGLLGVERFMREYFGHTRRVMQVAEAFQDGIREAGGVAGRTVRRVSSRVLGHRVDDLFRVGPRTVAVLPSHREQLVGSVAAVVRLVELSMIYDMPIEPATWEAVRAAAPALPRDPDREAVAAFLSLLASAEPAAAGLAPALRRLHEAAVLEIFLPPFAHARDLLQFNNYHKYTVDEHCIRAVGAAAEFARSPGWLGDAWRQLGRHRPLLLALVIHDLGKGFVEDHSEVGARMAREITDRLGLPEEEAEIIELLVLKHLAMAHLAFRRNTGDDSLLVGFARDVGSPEVLKMLAVLTAADMDAVGPGTWTKWKDDILGDLYFRTLAYLDGESPSRGAERTRQALAALLEDRAAGDPVVRLARQLPAAYLRDTPALRIVEELGRLVRLPDDGVFALARWQPDTGTVAVTVGTRDALVPGVFHRVTAALSAERLEILAADIHTLPGGHVIDHFVVLDPDFEGEPPAERLADIATAIKTALKADEPPRAAPRWNPFAPRVSPAAVQPVRVRFDNASSKQATILEVFAHDSAGLLTRIARALAEAELSVQSAKIGTYLDQVVDAFHVTDRNGGKVTDPARLAAVRRAIEAVAAPPVSGPD
jgi:[protein-PII] uridylyltransferase